MTVWLNTLSGPARLLMASVIVVAFLAMLLLPIGFGAMSLSGAMASQSSYTEVQTLLETRLASFEARRAERQADLGLSDAQLALYLDAERSRARFEAQVSALAGVLRDRGLTVSGDGEIAGYPVGDGESVLEAELQVTGALATLLQTLSEPEFANMRLSDASLASTSADGQVRGVMRFVDRHVTPAEEGGEDNAR